MSPFAYIGAAKLGLAGLGLYLTWSTSVAYEHYETVPRIWGLTAVEDQNVGGAMMMLEQSLVLLIAVVVLFVQMLTQSEAEEQRRERLERAAAALSGLLERLGVELPVVQAGMGGGLAGAGLAGTVSGAGGLGTVGFDAPEQLRAAIAGARERPAGPSPRTSCCPSRAGRTGRPRATADVVVTFWGRPRGGPTGYGCTRSGPWRKRAPRRPPVPTA